MSLKTDAEGQLLREILSARGGSQPTIDSCNQFYRSEIPKILRSRNFEIPDRPGVVATFTDPQFIRPNFINLQSGQSEKLMPYMARQKGLSYTAQLFCKLRLNQIVEGQLRPIPGEEADVFLGRIPVMLHSELDHLYGMSSAERYRAGDPEKDPGGYFIIKGMEKVLINIEKVRTLSPYLYEDQVRYTSQTATDSTLVVVQEDKEDIHVTFTKMGVTTNSINIFYIFYLLGFSENTVQNTLSIMENFIFDENPKRQARRRKELHQYLKVTISIFNNQTEGNRNEQVFKILAGKINDPDIKTSTDRNARLQQMVWTEMFKNIPMNYRTDQEKSSILLAKIRLLAGMVVKFVEFKNGYRDPDDRDSWAIKKISDAGDHMTTQFISIWKNMITTLHSNIIKKKLKTVNDIKNAIKQNYMTEQFIKAFTNGLWGGARGNNRDVAIVDTLKRDTLLAAHAHIRRITTPTNKRAQIRLKRLIHNSSWGAICPTMTPEGETCGLVKDPAMTVYISLNRDDSVIKARISGLYHLFPTEHDHDSVYLNGVHIGFANGPALEAVLKDLRIDGSIPFDTGIIFDQYRELTITTTSGRVCRPLARVDKETQQLVIDLKNLRGRPLEVLMREGAIEYIDIAEQQQTTMYIAETVQKLRDKRERRANMNQRIRELEADPDTPPKELESARVALRNIQNELPYTHAEVDPTAIIGISASIIPFPEFMPNPRGAYQASMGKQALGPNSSRIELRYDTTTKTLTNPEVPLLATDAHELLGLDEYPAGATVTVGITTYGGDNQEDAIIFNKASLELGKFNLGTYHSYKTTIAQTHNRQEKLKIPDYQPSQSHIYSKLDPETKIVKIGQYMKTGDCLVGKVAIVKSIDGKNKESDVSLYVEIGREGYVEDVFVTENQEGWQLIRIRLRETQTPQAGDKYASRYAQKGVIGGIIKKEDMPYIISEHELLNGVRPDILFNPHGLPSRMTAGKLIEMFVGKYTSITGERVNATAFRRFNYEHFRDELVRLGYSSSGKEKMVNGITGRVMDVEVFVGPAYYQALRHLVAYKMQARGKGRVAFLTHQPTSGIRKDGGLRFGEMERDAIIEHGASNILNERLMISSDAYKAVVCRECGTFANSNVERAEITCQECSKEKFGQVTIPYIIKLFMNYLSAIGISTRFQTQKIE